MAYNSQFTGAQIDEAIADVRSNKDAWNGKQDVILASGAAVGGRQREADGVGGGRGWHGLSNGSARDERERENRSCQGSRSAVCHRR